MNIEQEHKKIKEILDKAQKNMSKYPKESIGITKSNNYTQYYLTNDDGHRSYLSVNNQSTIQTLAQKAYDKKIIKNLLQELGRIEHFLKHYNPDSVTDVYKKFPDILKKYITPYELSDDDYANRWAKIKYETKGIEENAHYFVTDNGEKVRSKSELTIANKLFHKGIKYRYEEPLLLKGYGTVYPDFKILNKRTRKEILLEHFGLLDNPEYMNKCLKKLNTYANNGFVFGYNLFVTFETGTTPLSTVYFDRLLNLKFT